MKLRQRILIVVCILSLGAFAGVEKSSAQIWAHYDVQIANIFFNPVTGGNLLPVTGFRDFVGNPDPDDGVYNDVSTGFSFDYNGTTYNTVNVCVNGWLSVGKQDVPVITNDNTYLFRPNPPRNAIAPFWGDHYYRTLEPGFRPSQIQWQISSVTDPNPCTNPNITFPTIKTFTLEWKDLNINDKTNPNSIATFQVKIVQNAKANDCAVPDNRATIEFHYGNVSSTGTVTTQGATVGIKDSGSFGVSFLNGLFPSSVAGGDSARLSTTARTSSFPPSGLPGRVIQFVPKGTFLLNQWGDGDVTLDQIKNPDANVRANQNLFVTLADADAILISRTQPAGGNSTFFGVLDSVEGGAAFHGDANHNGRYQNPNFPLFNLYRATSYDAAYILLYLAAKLPVLPWPDPLPVPPYKETAGTGTTVSGVALDARNGHLIGNTYTVPVVLRGTVNGALSVEAVVKTSDASALQFVGTHTQTGANTLLRSNGRNGAVVLATSGIYNDGDVLGYLEFNVANRHDVSVSLDMVSINDESFAGPSVNVPLSTLDVASSANGFAVQQNVPNPFNMSEAQSTSIKFTMGVSENVSVRVFDMLGHEIRSLVQDEVMTPGAHAIQWDGRSTNGAQVANGLYYYQITSPSFTQTVKMEVIR
jgi:hypothetical protein